MGGRICDITQQNCIVLHGILSEVVPTTQYIGNKTGNAYYLKRIILKGAGDLAGNEICLMVPTEISTASFSSYIGKHVVCYIHCSLKRKDLTTIVNRLECWYMEVYDRRKVYPFNQMQITQSRMRRYMARMEKKMEKEPVKGIPIDDEGYALLD